MRSVLALLLILAPLTLLAEKQVTPATPAAQYPAHITQSNVTVAADPYDQKSRQDVFRVDYLKYNFIPIRIIVTNDSAKPVSLNDVRILLLPKAGGKINAAEPEDVERRVSSKARRGTTIPIGPLKIHRQGSSSDKKIEADFKDREYSALTVPAHTTKAGFLFYDVQGLGGNPLTGAILEFREIRDSSGKQLFAFDVPLDAYLTSQTE